VVDSIVPEVSITAVSGISGAGRSPGDGGSFVEVEGGARLYKAGTVHQHVSEIERVLADLTGGEFSVGFAPQIVPMSRGILLTALAQLEIPVDPETMHRHYQSHYTGEPFVQVLQPDSFPETKAVRGSNRADVWVTTIHGGKTLMVSVAIDNLVKGAAGQAMQNLNLMMGWPEVTGLSASGSPW
jgi:N-acetyl-gamma-glutamyl-phosphate reductase